MFCGHPSLRFGDVIHFIELWGNNPNNAIVFTGALDLFSWILGLLKMLYV